MQDYMKNNCMETYTCQKVFKTPVPLLTTEGQRFSKKIALYEQRIKEHLEVMMRLSEAFSILAATILGVREASR